jgi:hypothetical protein
MFCRLFDSTGAPVSSELRLSEVDDRQKFSPRAAYNPVAQEYMVVWLDYRNWPGTGQDNNYGDIYGQRVNPATGAKIGANVPVYAPLGPPYAPNGQDTPSGITCNTQDGRYAIGITKLTAQGWTTVGLVVNSNGSQIAPVFNLSRPNFGAQATPAYNPVSNTYFISYEATASNVGGKEISAAGAPVAGEEAVINNFGAIRDNVLTIRPADGQYLQVAVSDAGVLAAQRFVTIVLPPESPGDFDRDEDVDMTDFARLQLCFSGEAHTYSPGCQPQDLDHDLDVDEADFMLFSACLAGADRPPGC